MVERQLKARGIDDAHVVEAMRHVPREKFFKAGAADLAYADQASPIGHGQTISQPYMVALMIEAATIRPGDRVLEVGAGSGYAAAVIGRIAAKVVAVERQHELVEIARERLARLGTANVEIVEGDGTLGWPTKAPYDAILAAASGSHIPEPLIDQLAPGGRLVMPLGGPEGVQNLIKLTKRGDGTLEQSGLGAVRFVPLIGKEGWKEARPRAD
jgi:protein-L-isoaspartate(D-aspartate) O-methyltransferase